MENKAMGTIIVTLAIGALLGFGGGYYYMQPQVQDSFAQGMAYQQGITPQAVTATAAELDYTWDDSGDDTGTFELTVDGDGNVIENSDDDYIYIENVDDTLDATGVIITLKNPTTGASGIHEDFDDALDDIIITIDYGTLAGITLLKDGVFHDRSIGDIPSGAATEVQVTVTFLDHDNEDFPSGDTFDCELYVWQPSTDSFDTVDFTITTAP